MDKDKPKPSAPLVIQCPNPECGTTDIESDILICELMPTTWQFKVEEGHRLIADTATQENGEYIESTRHLYCTCCGTEWKVPTNAEVDWE